MRRLQYILLLLIAMFSNMTLAATRDAPGFSLPTADGQLELSSLRGKVVYLDFWASWCTPCKKSFPWMVEMKAAYKDQGFEIVAVNLDSERELADAFLNDVDVNFKIAFDEPGDTATLYELRGMPSSYLIGRDGKLYASHIGFRDKDKPKMEAAIKELLAQ